jgi:hypothetical protein
MIAKSIPDVKPLDPPLIGKIREVFLGATKKHLDEWRWAVRDALISAKAAVYLQEHWNSAADDTVEVCRRNLEKSSGYVGIFGFRYGWIPQYYDCSITEMECGWAFQRWSAAHPPPVFIFLPDADSEAERLLQAKAEETLIEEFPEEQQRDHYRKRQAAFVERIRTANMPVNFFSDRHDLQVRTVVAISHWNTDLLERALQQRDLERRFIIPPQELGRLGRSLQLRSLRRALAARDRRSDAPALCALVQGQSDSGLSEFRATLASWPDWELGREVEPGRPQGDPYSTTLLLKWAIETAIVKRPIGELSAD